MDPGQTWHESGICALCVQIPRVCEYACDIQSCFDIIINHVNGSLATFVIKSLFCVLIVWRDQCFLKTKTNLSCEHSVFFIIFV